jgi:dipeptidase E
MKLYLSSYMLGDHPEQMTAMVGNNKKTAIIMNAADQYDPAKRPAYRDREIEKLDNLGLEAEELDLRDYFDDHGALAARLSRYGLVWVMGGNTFVLRRAMRASGFDEIITGMVQADKIVYGGFSAGACVVAPTLRGLELCDDPSIVPDGYDSEVIWEGLGFVPYSIAPHYRSPGHPETELVEQVITYFEEHNMPYRALRDGEAIVVDA